MTICKSSLLSSWLVQEINPVKNNKTRKKEAVFFMFFNLMGFYP
jgi:hypothetical protein